MNSFIIITKVLAIGTVLIQIGFVVTLVLFLLKDKAKKAISFIVTISPYIFTILLGGAALMSIIYSDYFGLEPCSLCWYQRVIVYSTFVISLIALIRKEFTLLLPYLKILLGIGLLFAIYNVFLQFGSAPSIGVLCDATEASSCANYFFKEFGYITMPVMNTTLLAFLLSLSFFKKK
jgi:disulfide bond formation protein DsbB